MATLSDGWKLMICSQKNTHYYSNYILRSITISSRVQVRFSYYYIILCPVYFLCSAFWNERPTPPPGEGPNNIFPKNKSFRDFLRRAGLNKPIKIHDSRNKSKAKKMEPDWSILFSCFEPIKWSSLTLIFWKILEPDWTLVLKDQPLKKWILNFPRNCL